jgi:hypothetical protein
MSECEKCGLEDPDCHCYLYEIEDRVSLLEEGLDQLTEVVKKISEFLKIEFCTKCKNELVACVCMEEE